MRLTKKIIYILFPLFISAPVLSSEAVATDIQSETYQIGLMVQSIQNSLDVRDEQALQTIRLYGTDSRYYSMIRGWLFQELVGVESLLHVSKTEERIEKFQTHSNFLKKAIRSVDLE